MNFKEFLLDSTYSVAIIGKDLQIFESNENWKDLMLKVTHDSRVISFLSTFSPADQSLTSSSIDDFFSGASDFQSTFNITLPIEDHPLNFRLQLLPIQSDMLAIVVSEVLFKTQEQESACFQSDRLLATLLSSTPNAILIVNTKLNVLYFSPAFPFLDLLPRDLLNSSQMQLEEIYLSQKVLSVFKKAIEKNEVILLEEEVIDLYGKKRKHSLKLVPLLFHEKVVGAISFIRDITEDHSQESEFLSNYKASVLGNLAGGVAHELNTPLGITRLSAEFLLKNLEESEFDPLLQTKYLNQIIKSVDKMTSIVKQVMSYSKPTKAAERTNESINDIVKDTLAMYGKILRSADIELDLRFDERVPLIKVDLGQIQVVVTDLVNNARESLANTDIKEKKLLIETSYVEDLNCIKIRFSNNSPPIDVESRDKIFESCFEAEKPSNAAQSKIGLGFSVSYGIIRSHKGLISYSSEDETGNCFTVMLPLDEQ